MDVRLCQMDRIGTRREAALRRFGGRHGEALGRPVRRRAVAGTRRAERLHAFRLGARAVRHRGLAGARARPAPGRPARTTPSSPTCSPPSTSLDADVGSGAFQPRPDDEDVHTALERGLLERAGAELGGKLRAGRSRNDQVATLYRMYLREHARAIAGLVLDLQEALLRPGAATIRTPPCPAGRTSSTRSRCCSRTTWPPTRRRSAATCDRIRDWDRRAAVSPYGSGALAGSSLGLDPAAVAAELGFDAAGGELHRRHGLSRLRRRAGVRARDDRRRRLAVGRGDRHLQHRGIRLRCACTTPTPPDRRSCRRRRTRTSPSWRGARAAG